MATPVNKYVDQGTSKQESWTVFTDPTHSIQADISGFTEARMNVCASYDSTQVLQSYSTEAGNMTINVASSTVTVNVANTDFLKVQFPQNMDAPVVVLVYDVKLNGANGSARIAQGQLTLSKQVTI